LFRHKQSSFLFFDAPGGVGRKRSRAAGWIPKDRGFNPEKLAV
jgi:hypothetical protein